MDHARTIYADEADVITVSTMHAGYVGKAAPARAPRGRHLGVGQIRPVGNDAAGIIPGEARTGPEKNGAGQRLAGRSGQQVSECVIDPQSPMHYNSPRPTLTDTSLDACGGNEKPATASLNMRRAWRGYHMARLAVASASYGS